MENAFCARNAHTRSHWRRTIYLRTLRKRTQAKGPTESAHNETPCRLFLPRSQFNSRSRLPTVRFKYEKINTHKSSSEKEKLKILRGARPIAPAPVDSSPKVNPVLSRQTEFDCHQCGLACHSWANLEKHLQAHEEADVAGDSTSEVSQFRVCFLLLPESLEQDVYFGERQNVFI